MDGETLKNVHLPMFGRHNVENALAAAALGREMGIENEQLLGGLASFEGVNRRFTKTGVVGGITVIDDYGHHPVEISSVLKAARDATSGQVIAVVQPHRYSRLKDLFEDFCTCFNDADAVLVADVYEAGEKPIEGINRDALVAGLRERGHRLVAPLSGPDELAVEISKLAKSGDMVVLLGAGDITHWAQALPGQLSKIIAKTINGGG